MGVRKLPPLLLRNLPAVIGPASSAPDDISGAVTVILPPRRALGPWASLLAWLPPGKLWPPSRRTAALALLCSPVLAGIVVATQLRPRGAEKVGASVLAYVAPSAQDGVAPPFGPGDRLAVANLPPDALVAPPPPRVSEGPRCELPVVQVEALPVARAEPPVSPWAAFASTPVLSADTPPAPPALPPAKHAAKAKMRGHRSIDDLVRKMNASTSPTKY